MTQPHFHENREMVKFYWMVPYQPWSEDEDLRQRDLAAEAARQWARDKYPQHSVNVYAVNRGPVNLVVSVALS
jgi:hypothetical protein